MEQVRGNGERFLGRLRGARLVCPCNSVSRPAVIRCQFGLLTKSQLHVSQTTCRPRFMVDRKTVACRTVPLPAWPVRRPRFLRSPHTCAFIRAMGIRAGELYSDSSPSILPPRRRWKYESHAPHPLLISRGVGPGSARPFPQLTGWFPNAHGTPVRFLRSALRRPRRASSVRALDTSKNPERIYSASYTFGASYNPESSDAY